MFTQAGTIKVEARVDDGEHKALNRTLFVSSLICLIMGSSLLFISILTGIISKFVYIDTYSYDYIQVIGLFLFVIGLINIINYNRALRVVRSWNKVKICEFHNNYMTFDIISDGELTEHAKYYYRKFSSRRETKDYLIFYTDIRAALAVKKAAMTEQELNIVRVLTGLKSGTVLNYATNDVQGNAPSDFSGTSVNAGKEAPRDEQAKGAETWQNARTGENLSKTASDDEK